MSGATTVNVKYVEFGGISLDLRHVNYPISPNKFQNNNYIVFLNVNKAFYTNFDVVTDMSLETLTHYIYENVEYRIDEKLQKFQINYEHFRINEHDDNKSIIIEFEPQARIIVAKAIRAGEKYSRRVSGYIDFENRHNSSSTKTLEMNTQERLDYDKACEIELLKYT
ncbi:unknown [Euproctis pseudoconspersa nucleopolyhedrovirus]|uniref:Ac57 n=1 Tax=Euproctis pseudoconspersa nucleopolyhedrovirus TaxID=307467 RepID=C3TWU1_9ABAC|nr:hypothetical protein EupsNPV_gp033 [Euproctis pseudoconspersa nucleopolyhedrovirus]ACO53483.1 unknown [Euproctis pseudoconspersa nucleopolyhedrovirus]QUJ09224.1 hypothetical protein Gyru_ORF29 [Gynaephora ruoergensis nucleopolyhedrovirus]